MMKNIEIALIPFKHVIEPFSGVKLRNSLKFCFSENEEIIFENVEASLDSELKRIDEIIVTDMKINVARLKDDNIHLDRNLQPQLIHFH
jgi:hypothetical protein